MMLVHDLQCSEMLREQLLYRRKNKSQHFFALRTPDPAAARPLTSRPMAAPPFESFRQACSQVSILYLFGFFFVVGYFSYTTETNPALS